MKISENTPRTSTMIQGIKVSVPVVIEEATLAKSEKALAEIGFPLSSAAAMLQQTFVENVVNNCASSVKEEIAKVLENMGVKDWDGKIKSLDDETKAAVSSAVDLASIQALVDAYIAEYVPGVRRSGSTSEPIDPVEAAAYRLAKIAIQDRLEKLEFTWEGNVYSGVGRTARADSYKAFDAYCQKKYGLSASDFINQKVEETVESTPFFREQARQQIEGAAAAKLDLGI